jgi:hypothetical protein
LFFIHEALKDALLKLNGRPPNKNHQENSKLTRLLPMR